MHEKCDKNFPNNFCSISMEKFQPNRHYFWPNIRPKVSANAAEYSVSAETRFFSFGRTLASKNGFANFSFENKPKISSKWCIWSRNSDFTKKFRQNTSAFTEKIVKLMQITPSGWHQNMASKFGINLFPRDKIEAKVWCHPAECNLLQFHEKIVN